ncbi:MAG: hypothetical protein FJW38_19965 [Acidobacteria bacterium]|nr:hypothetical protein [Acidobacteriota bacterium]
MQRMLDSGLFERLPATFTTYTLDRLRGWDLLFPAERSYFERLLAMFERSDSSLVDQLFAPLAAVESKMGVDARAWRKQEFSLAQVDFLQRSPHYAEWRSCVADIFARVDPLLDQEVASSNHTRLLIVSSPSDLPVGPDRMWLRIAGHGQRVPLELPAAGLDPAEYLPLLLTGGAGARSLLDRNPLSRYDAWLIDAGERHLSLLKKQRSAVAIGYGALADYRARVMAEVRKVVESKRIQGPQQLGAELRRMASLMPPGELGADPLVADFVRNILLAGNGTLLINNTFTEWAAVQALRRARPTLSVVSFGIRNKVKPFSSLLIYEDQERASAIPTQVDTLGTYVDLEIFYQYVLQECGKHAEYRGTTLALFVAEGMDELLMVAPPSFRLPSPRPTLVALHEAAGEWLGWSA